MRAGVVTFPGSLDDRDAQRAIGLAGAEPVALWYGDDGMAGVDGVAGVDAVVLPGGFSYGDYLRGGAIARFAPIMSSVIEAASGGMPVLGICNGFQMLCESHLLPGALIRNLGQKFICRPEPLIIENVATSWTRDYSAGQRLLVPIKNNEGCYVAEAAELDALEAEGRVVARYADGSPNGAYRDIAGVTNERGNVVGLMPHPEHAIDPLCGPSGDGLGIFTSVLAGMVAPA